jgi:phosphatidylglycerol:prolipoprotein diacylglycerol transferase
MCPEFFHIGSFALRAYGLSLALSFLIGLSLMRREARLVGLNPDRIANLGFVLIIFGVLGGRLGYVLYHLPDFIEHPLDIINPFHASGPFGIAGLNLQGGLIGGLVAGVIYLRSTRLPILPSLDAAAPAAAFGIFLTRIGCFLNGCCFGKPTLLFWGVHYPPDAAATAVFGPHAVHPTQLYSSAYGLLLYFGLHQFNRRFRRPGLAIGFFFTLEAVFRFAIEPLRYYENEMWFESGGVRVTYNQIVALALLLLGLAILLWSRTHERKTA